MIRSLPLLIAGALALASCSEGQQISSTPAPIPSSVASSVSLNTASAGAPSSQMSSSEISPEPTLHGSAIEPDQTQARTAYVVECLPDPPGASQMSDGTIQNTEYCQHQDHEQESHDAETNAGLTDPATIPYANGGTCPAAICGYGHDAQGRPNPSSGEIQTMNGCDEG